jgi:hypothetical protein
MTYPTGCYEQPIGDTITTNLTYKFNDNGNHIQYNNFCFIELIGFPMGNI